MSISRLTNARRVSASGVSAARGSYFHVEALDWQSRVVTNGGSVSASTLQAVSAFCRAIDDANIRDCFLRLNLFCGTGLAAALVPLYRGASLSGTQYGNTTDTNTNFVSGDYTETGTSGGLKGNGTSKYLNTGLAPSDLASRSSLHMSCSGTSLETSGDRSALGVYGTTNAEGQIYSLDLWAAYAASRCARFSAFTTSGSTPVNFPFVTTPSTAESHFIATRTANNDCRIFQGSSQSALQTATVTPATTTRPVFVFALNDRGTATAYTAAALRMYSIGNGLTASQCASFSLAVLNFHNALSRL